MGKFMDIYLSEKRGSENVLYYFIFTITLGVIYKVLVGLGVYLGAAVSAGIGSVISIIIALPLLPMMLNVDINFILGFVSKVLGFFGVSEETRHPIEDFFNIGRQSRYFFGHLKVFEY